MSKKSPPVSEERSGGKPSPPSVMAKRPRGFPDCCKMLGRVNDVLFTDHMLLLDVEDPPFPALVGLADFQDGKDTLLRTDMSTYRSSIELVLECMDVLHRCSSPHKGEKVLPDKDGTAEAQVTIGNTCLRLSHLRWAKKLIGGTVVTLSSAQSSPVLLEVDGELRGLIQPMVHGLIAPLDNLATMKRHT